MFSTLLAHTHGWDGGPGPWIVFPILWFVLWIGVIAFVVTRFRRGGPPWARHSGQTVLAERFARGDITADEYRTRRDVLKETER
jgi:putative membrane protein